MTTTPGSTPVPTEPSGWFHRATHRIDWFLAATLIAVAAIQIVTMPSMFYPGDNYVSRMEAMYWIQNGEMGIPYSERAQLGGMVGDRGQYFY